MGRAARRAVRRTGGAHEAGSRPSADGGVRPDARRTGLALVATVLGLALVGGCSWVKDPGAASDGEGDGSAVAELPGEPGDGAPTAFDNPAAVTLEETSVSDAWAGGDQVLTLAADGVRSRTLPQLDVDYRLTPGQGGAFTDLWVDGDAGEAVVAEIAREAGEGTAVGADTVTLTRFDLATGESLDAGVAEIDRDPQAGAADTTVHVVGAEGDEVVAEVVSADATVATTVTFDLDDGEALWDRPGARALAVADGTAVLGTWAGDAPGAVVAVDLATGEEVWTTQAGAGAGSALGVTSSAVGGTVTVAVAADPDDEDARVVTLDLADGEVASSTPAQGWDWGCDPASDGDALVVCTVAGERVVVGWDLARAGATWSLPAEGRFAPVVTAVADDLVYGLLDTGVGVVLDASTGEDVAADTGAGPVAVNDRAGVVLYEGRAVLMPRYDPEPTDEPDDQ